MILHYYTRSSSMAFCLNNVDETLMRDKFQAVFFPLIRLYFANYTVFDFVEWVGFVSADVGIQ